MVGVLASIVKLWVPELNLGLVILSAIAVILPGYTVSLGAAELVAQHVVSGAANLMSGLICLVKQVTGGWLGVALASLAIPMTAAGPATPVDPVWLWLLFPLLLVGLCLVFQTSDVARGLAIVYFRVDRANRVRRSPGCGGGLIGGRPEYWSESGKFDVRASRT